MNTSSRTPAPRTSRTTRTRYARSRASRRCPGCSSSSTSSPRWSATCPDFVTGLVNIAQRGRSLGIHLLLATQRPSGVVSPEIRANTNLRIALRVTDGERVHRRHRLPRGRPSPSRTPVVPMCGSGASSLVPFQSGRVGGRRPGAASGGRSPVGGPARLAGPGARSARKPEAGGARGRGNHRPQGVGGRGTGSQRAARHPTPAQPVATGAVRDSAAGRGSGTAEHGRAGPRPRTASRTSPATGAATGQHRLLSLRSSADRWCAAQRPLSGAAHHRRFARPTHSVADVHMYGIDCGNGALLPLTRLPHCGAVVGRAPDRAADA